MISKDKGIFRQLINKHDLPVYMQDWYMDVVCSAGSWSVYMLLEESEIHAVWLAGTKSKFGLSYAVNLPLTPYGGLHIVNPSVSQLELNTLIAAVISDHQFIEQDIHPDHSELFSGSTEAKVTYMLPLSTSEVAWSNMKSGHRRKVRRAEEQFRVDNTDFSSFRKLLHLSFLSKNREDPYPTAAFIELDKACAKHNSRIILGAYSGQGDLQGAAYFLKDDKYVYYLGGGHLDNQYSMYLLIWSGIRMAMEQGLAFDFEGSMIPGVAQFFKGFGGCVRSYPVFSHSSSWLVQKIVELKKHWS